MMALRSMRKYGRRLICVTDRPCSRNSASKYSSTGGANTGAHIRQKSILGPGIARYVSPIAMIAGRATSSLPELEIVPESWPSYERGSPASFPQQARFGRCVRKHATRLPSSCESRVAGALPYASRHSGESDCRRKPACMNEPS